MPFNFTSEAADPNTLLSPEENAAVQSNSVSAPPTDVTVPVAGQQIMPDTSEQTYEKAALYGLPAIGVGAIDSLGYSLGVFHDDTVAKSLKAVMPDEGGFADFYSQHKDAARIGGDIATIAIPGIVATKIMRGVRLAREAGTVGEWLKNSTAVDKLLGTSADLTNAEAKVATAAKSAVQDFGATAGRTFDTPAVISAKRSYTAARAVEAARQTAAFEATYRVMFSQSDIMNPADQTWQDQAMWGVTGLAAGVGLDFAAGRYVARKLLQTAGKTDVNSAVSNVIENIANVVPRPNDRGPTITTFASSKNTLKGLVDVNGSPQFATNVKQDVANFDVAISKQLDEMAGDKHPILPRTKLDPEQKQLAISALEDNETTFLYGKKLSYVPAKQEDFFDEINKLKDKNEKDYATNILKAGINTTPEKAAELTAAARDQYNAMDDVLGQVHYVIENDGDYSVYRNRADRWLDNNSFKDIKRSTFLDDTGELDADKNKIKLKRSKLTLSGDNQVSLNDDFTYNMPANPTPADYSALYAAGSKMIAEWKPVEGQRFILTPKVPWRTTEMTMELLNQHPEVGSLIDYADGFTGPKDAQFHVVDQKYKEWQKLSNQIERKPTTALQARLAERTGKTITPAQVVAQLNLPIPKNGTPTPLMETFAAGKLEGQTTMDAMFNTRTISGDNDPFAAHPLDNLQANFRNVMNSVDPTKTFDIGGPLLKQKDIRPIFVAASSTPMMDLATLNLPGILQTRRTLQMSKMAAINSNDAPIVSGVFQRLVGGDGMSAVGKSAQQVSALHDGELSGSGLVVFQDRINEQNPTLKATQLLAQQDDKIIRSQVAGLIEGGLKQQVSDALLPKNRAVLFDFNRIEQSYRHGWDIKNVDRSPDGAAVFVLDNESQQNRALMAKHFPNEEIPEEDEQWLMPDMSTAGLRAGFMPLKVDPRSAGLANSISNLSKRSGVEYNMLAGALGISPTRIRDFHLPTPDLFKDDAWFVRNSRGQVIATYSHGSFKENRQLAQSAAGTLSDIHQELHTAVPINTVRDEHSLSDPTFFNVINYSDQLAKSGAIRGGLQHTQVDNGPTTLTAMMQSLERQFLNVGTRARGAVFEPELNYARQASQVTGKLDNKELNIFDRYIATMLGRSTLSPKGNITQPYMAAEQSMDNVYNYMSTNIFGPAGAVMRKGTEAFLSTKIGQATVRKMTSLEEYQAFENQKLSKWSPFEDAQQWAEGTARIKFPPSIKTAAAKLSLASATMSFRMLDVGTAINNFLGLASNIPAVTTALRRLPTEDVETWTNRTAAYASNYVPDIATFSPQKALTTAIKSYWKGELNEPMAAAAKMGMFDPEYAALAKAMTAPRTGISASIAKWTDTASYLADHSEIMARKLSWGLGYKIGKDLHQFDDERNAYTFANHFVNNVIGNYDPKNKPAMFQGVIGMPLGAFQTYMFNYYRRMYQYLETGDKAALVAGYAAQASLFGVKSVPGWGAFNSYLFNDKAKGDDVESRLSRGLPSLAADLLLHGSVDVLPAIFGEGGLAFSTRGSVDFQQLPPTALTANKAPPLVFLTKTADMITKTMQNVLGAGGYSMQQQEEIIANTTTNRTLRNLMVLAANAKTDQTGAVIQAGTRDAIHVAATLLGTQPSSQQRLVDAYTHQRSVELTQEDLRTQLNDKTRALVRGGDFDVSDLQSVAQSYVKSGGNPAYFGEWLRNTMVTATTPKAQEKMKELASSQKYTEFLTMLSTLQQQ